MTDQEMTDSLARRVKIEDRRSAIGYGAWRVYFKTFRPQLSKMKVIEVQRRDTGRPIIPWGGFDQLEGTQKWKLALAHFFANAPTDISFLVAEIIKRDVEIVRLQKLVRQLKKAKK